ncbi:DUF3429 domain-containing protein [Salinisphaera sp. T31B1]|uniref:DUF3429 domain-containing protein n=1 Tax=Salinisphaera sp. T31B1 TaxID=727963 RepID=UPI00333F143D
MAQNRSPMTLAALLGLAALLPFLAGVTYAYTGSTLDAGTALRWLMPYLATIVGFIGGVQWGRLLSRNKAGWPDMIWPVIPALIAWAALLTANPWRILLLLGALLLAWLVDEYGARRGWQSRTFLQLRRLLTAGVSACVIAIVWRVVRG